MFLKWVDYTFHKVKLSLIACKQKKNLNSAKQVHILSVILSLSLFIYLYIYRHDFTSL